jgi:hypothetical protein
VVEAAAKTTGLTGIARKPRRVRQRLKAPGKKPRKGGTFPVKPIDLAHSHIPRRPHHRRAANGFHIDTCNRQIQLLAVGTEVEAAWRPVG